VPGPTSEISDPGVPWSGFGFGWSRDGTKFAWFVGGALQVFGEGAPAPIENPGAQIRAIAFSPDGRSVATGCTDGRVRSWDVATGRVGMRAVAPGAVSSVAWSRDGAAIVVGTSSAKVVAFDAATGATAWTYDAATVPRQRDTQIARDAVAATWVDPDGVLQILDLRDERRAVTAVDVHGKDSAYPWKRAVSADLRRIVALQDVVVDTKTKAIQSMLRAWDVGSTSPPAEMKQYGDFLAVSVDGRVAAAGDREVAVYDLAVSPPRQVTLIAAPPLRDRVAWSSSFTRAAFSRDASRLAVGDIDGVVHVYSIPSGVEVRTLRGHRATIMTVAFSDDGTMLASGSLDGTALIWDLRD
jgi:WD40 repeat protein